MKRQHAEKKRQALVAIASWKESGLSQQAFCRKENFNSSTFQRWRRRYDPAYEFRTKHQLTEESSTHCFIALEMQTTTQVTAERIEIIYPNGVQIHCSPELNEPTLRKLVSLKTT